MPYIVSGNCAHLVLIILINKRYVNDKGSVSVYLYTKTEPVGNLLLPWCHASEANHLQAQGPHEREEMLVGRPKLDSERLLVLCERTVNPLGVEPFAEDA